MLPIKNRDKLEEISVMCYNKISNSILRVVIQVSYWAINLKSHLKIKIWKYKKVWKLCCTSFIINGKERMLIFFRCTVDERERCEPIRPSTASLLATSGVHQSVDNEFSLLRSTEYHCLTTFAAYKPSMNYKVFLILLYIHHSAWFFYHVYSIIISNLFRIDNKFFSYFYLLFI